MSTMPQSQPTVVDPKLQTPEEIAEQLAQQTAPGGTQQQPLERDFSVTLETGQTYRGNTKDELVQQLVKAQENASRRIKELSDSQQQPTQQQVQQVQQQEPQFDQNRYYQLLATDPISANDYYLDFSPKAKALNQQMQQLEAMRTDIAQRTEFATFQNSVSDFPFDNQDAINKFDAEFPKLGLSWTAQNLMLAHALFLKNGYYTAPAAAQQQQPSPQTMPTMTGQTQQWSTGAKSPEQMTADELKTYIESLQGQR